MQELKTNDRMFRKLKLILEFATDAHGPSNVSFVVSTALLRRRCLIYRTCSHGLFCSRYRLSEHSRTVSDKIPEFRRFRPSYFLSVGPAYVSSHCTHRVSLHSGGGPYVGRSSNRDVTQGARHFFAVNTIL